MQNQVLIAALTLLVSAMPVMAQETGGTPIAPQFMGQGAIKGLARPLQSARTPFLTAHDVQNGMTAADHQAQNQSTITNLRGDAGYLGGFQFGQPLSASRQPAVQDPGWDNGWHQRHRHDAQPIIINNEGPVAITNGNGNLVQQQSSNGASGPVAQQQIANTPSAGSGGALNLVTGGGNIVQRAPH